MVSPTRPPARDLHRCPFIVFYEITRACDLACAHCRACAMRQPHANQLTTDQSCALIDQLAGFPDRPLLVLTGGDPLKRADLPTLVDHAVARGLSVSLAPAATPLASRKTLADLRGRGVERIAVSLDGLDPATHDALRRVPGSHHMAMRVIADANAVGLPVQINTVVNPANLAQIERLGRSVAAQPGVVLWSVFFLVPVGRAVRDQCIAPAQYEAVFETLHRLGQETGLAIKTTEAPFYRRFMLQHHASPQTGPRRGPLGINDGKGVMFISHTGQVFPSGFLPIDCGRFPGRSVIDIYQHHPLFRGLRDPDQLKGKCGVCEFRQVCGGSRARAFAVTGDPLAAETDCVYQPKAWRPSAVAGPT